MIVARSFCSRTAVESQSNRSRNQRLNCAVQYRCRRPAHVRKYKQFWSSTEHYAVISANAKAGNVSVNVHTEKWQYKTETMCCSSCNAVNEHQVQSEVLTRTVISAQTTKMTNPLQGISELACYALHQRITVNFVLLYSIAMGGRHWCAFDSDFMPAFWQTNFPSILSLCKCNECRGSSC